MTLRDVTRKARVNLSAVNYHYGSKEELVRAVVHERIHPINEERLRRLDQLKAEHAPHPIPVEAVFSALIRPLFESGPGGQPPDPAFIRLIGRAITEPVDFLRGMHEEFFAELCSRFLTELRRSSPCLSERDLHFRFYCAIGTMIGNIVEQTRMETISGSKFAPADFDTLVSESIQFVVAGFQHPANT